MVEFADLQVLEKIAMSGGEMPIGLCLPDQLLFMSLRSLYSQYKQQIISREIGANEKKKLLDSVRWQRTMWECADRWVQCIKDTEVACSAYRKDRTLENADLLVESIDGVKVNGR